MFLIFKFIVIGLAIGTVSGAIGIGGGILLVPVLIWLGFDQTRAVGTTLGVMVPPIGLLAAWKYFVTDNMDLHAALWIALSFALGAYGGATLATSPAFPKYYVRIAFGLMMVYIGLRFVIMSDPDSHRAFLALSLVAASWVAFLSLKFLGRSYRRKILQEEMERLRKQPPASEPDYTI